MPELSTISSKSISSSGYSSEPNQDAIQDLADIILRNKALANTRAVILIGAGCSISAGIPSAAKIAQECCKKLAKAYNLDGVKKNSPLSALKALVKNGKLSLNWSVKNPRMKDIDWGKVYLEIFSKHYSSPDETRKIFDKFIEKGAGKINWAHIVLGELTAQEYFSSIVTTNFDQLALEGLVRANVLPVISDGVESLNRITGNPKTPQLIQIHGSRHTYRLRNSAEDVDEIAKNTGAVTAMQQLFQHASVFIIADLCSKRTKR